MPKECFRCGNPSIGSWHICSDNRRSRHLCAGCYNKLDRLVARFLRTDTAKRSRIEDDSCARCKSELSSETWQVDGGEVRLCIACDAELNRRGLRFLGFDDWRKKYADYVVRLYRKDILLFGDVPDFEQLAQLRKALERKGLWPSKALCT
jgi:NAD-dependent SIR2 family protein deacetylase